MKAIVKAFAAAGIAAVLSTPVHAQRPEVTFTTTGIVEIGDDDLHLFSDPGQSVSLAGLPFKMSISIDPDFLEVADTSPSATILRRWEPGASYYGEMTLNGRTFRWKSDPATAEATVELTRAQPWLDGIADRALMSAYGGDGGTRRISATSSITSYGTVPFIGSVDPMQETSFPLYMDGTNTISLLSVRDSDPAVNATTFIRALDIQSAIWHVSPVPEPSQYLLLGAGLAAILALRRRRRRGMRPLAFAALLLGAAVAGPASAQSISFTTSGVIAAGNDAMGLFSGGSLAGQSYTMSLKMDVDTLDAASWSLNHAYLENWDRTAKVSGELTVNGKVFSWDSVLANAQAGQSLPHGGFGNDANMATMSMWSGELAQMQVYATSLLTSTTHTFLNDVEPLSDIDFSASLPLITSQSYFQASQWDAAAGAAEITWLRAAPVATAVWEVSPVPEPAHAGMLAAGLGVLALARRRKAAAWRVSCRPPARSGRACAARDRCSGRSSGGCGCGRTAAARR